MANRNLNSVLNNVRVNDNVVTATSIGLQLANQQAAAVLSQRWPASAGPEPMMRSKRADLEKAKAYRDPNPTRAGRSVRPAGCHVRHGHTARPAVLTGRPEFIGSTGKRLATSVR